MNRKLTQQEFEEIETLVNNALNAYTKKDAERYIRRLEFLSNTMSYDVAGNIRNIFSELVCSTKRASGQIMDKERFVSFARTDLYKLEGFGVERSSNDD